MLTTRRSGVTGSKPRQACPELVLCRWCAAGVPLSDWLLFLDTRVRWSTDMGQGDFLWSMRNATVTLVTFLMELQIRHSIATSDGTGKKPSKLCKIPIDNLPIEKIKSNQ